MSYNITMSELRWHPFLQEWVITATHRQERTYHPVGYCPLCPTQSTAGTPVKEEEKTEIPFPQYDIAVFENKFPSLRPDAGKPSVSATPYSPVLPSNGVCEVVCYTSDHNATMADMPLRKIRALIDVWTDRFEELGKRPEIEYVFIFENKGKEIGVTLNHPHGQIYAFPHIPPKPRIELEGSLKYFEEHGSDLMGDIVKHELATKERLVAENNGWIAFVPFFARYPYELYITPKAHRGSLLDLSSNEKDDMARILQLTTKTYDALFGFSLPYMMLMHQTPTDGNEYPHYRFHIEFLPIYRTENKLKYLAGSESGAGAFINDNLPENMAKTLREKMPY